ncbi:MAG TPA: hydantoinase/oxoprolinase family protein [Solirubrobacterales bacterium]|nr:hydantoinase/oxoprolinase family protein [Solirubrobacterales bacterium]
MTVRVGIDVGGTFTDAVRIDDETGEITRAKVLTTAHDQSEGTMAALQRLVDDPADVGAFHHGYTVGLNAALTRTGAKAGMLVTAGHRDTMDHGRVWRPFDENLYDPAWRRPHQARPMVERRLRREVPERMRENGEVLLELDEEATREELEFLKREGVEAVGVCLINAYEHPEHEKRVREIVAEVLPDAYVQTSDIWPLAREFERTFVVALDAYTGPPVVRYLERLEKRLEEAGFDTRVEIMQMDGGLRTSPSVRQAPVYTLQSGPVAGLLGAEGYSRELLDGRNLVCLDIGGTSSDLGVIIDGAAEVTNEWELEHAIPLAITTLDVRSIGAGGGSIIGLDEVGSLKVGPESAGSEPGPACYGRGGERPAMTDAYVAMGLLQPELFLGGEMKLDRDAALAALGGVAGPLKMDPIELAQGAYSIANVTIAAALARMTTHRGYDPREFSLLGYGAAGPVHAVSVARELGIDEVVIPYFPGGFSAYGMVASRSRVEYSEATMTSLEGLGAEALNEALRRQAARCREDLLAQGVPEGEIAIECAYYGMYTGQGEDNRLSLPGLDLTDDDIPRIVEDFHSFYDRRFGYRAPEIPIFVSSVSAVGYGRQRPMTLPAQDDAGGDDSGVERAVIMRETLHIDGGSHPDSAFYDRNLLRDGDEVEGPAIIDDHLGTIVVNPGATARVVSHGTLRIEV